MRRSAGFLGLTVLTLVGVFAVVGITAGAAFANITTFTIDEDATLAPGGLQVVVTGTLLCTPGDTASILIIVAQDRGQQTATANGSSGTIACDGTLQDWGITASSNSPFKNGPAAARGTASSTSPGMPPTFDSAMATARLHLH
jgi:hypothetical protein